MTHHDTAIMMLEHMEAGEFYIITSWEQGNDIREGVHAVGAAIEGRAPPYAMIGAAWPRRWQTEALQQTGGSGNKARL